MTFSEYCQSEFGYTTITSFWDDFAIADRFGYLAILDTYDRAFKEWHTNIKYFTELVLVLNHRLWMHFGAGREKFAKAYDYLWKEAMEWASENLSDEDADYFYRTLD